jgi:putrescine:ornithine antiporter
MVIGTIAMLYSVYALYDSGGDAVMGGMLVLGVTYIIWGFISNRFTSTSTTSS